VDLRRKTDLLIILLLIAAISAIGYAVVRNYTLNVKSTVGVVVSGVVASNADLQLITSDNTTVVTSISVGNLTQDTTGTWSGYLKNTGNVGLHTFSIWSPDLGSVGNVTWNMPVTGDLDVGQMYPVTIDLTVDQTDGLSSYTFTIQITAHSIITSLTEVVVYASDPDDGIVRDWGLTIDRPMVPEQEGGMVGYIGADAYGNYFSGDTLTLSWTFSPGPHYLVFIVGQRGGPSYGTYSGTVTINGQVFSFSGLDVAHSITIYFTI